MEVVLKIKTGRNKKNQKSRKPRINWFEIIGFIADIIGITGGLFGLSVAMA